MVLVASGVRVVLVAKAATLLVTAKAAKEERVVKELEPQVSTRVEKGEKEERALGPVMGVKAGKEDRVSTTTRLLAKEEMEAREETRQVPGRAARADLEDQEEFLARASVATEVMAEKAVRLVDREARAELEDRVCLTGKLAIVARTGYVRHNLGSAEP